MNAKEYRQEGNKYLEQKEFPKAIDNYNKAIELDPSGPLPYNNLGNVYYNLKDFPKAIEYYIKAIELDSNYRSPYNGLGNVYFNLQDYPKAIDNYNKVIKLDPDYAAPYNGLANIYDDLKDYPKAIDNYNKAIELDSNYPFPFNGLGNVYYNLEDYHNAIDNYNKAVELDPNVPFSYNGLGNVYFNLQDYPKAIDNYNKAIESDPDYAAPYNGLGNVYDDLKDYSKAIDNYNKAIELDPNLAAPYNGLGNIYYNLEDYPNTIDNYNKAVELDPNVPLSYNGLGNVYNDLGDYHKAIDNYHKAVEIDVNFPLPYKGLGDVFFRLNEYAKAMMYFNKFFYLSIGHENIRKSFPFLLKEFESYPKTIEAILAKYKINSEEIFSFQIRNVLEQLSDFNLLVNYYKKSGISNINMVRLKSILYYYLGGPIESFILFNYESNNDEYNLTPQELYYFALIAREIDVEAINILKSNTDTLESRKNLEGEDFYYLGHLYLLKEEDEKSIDYFSRAANSENRMLSMFSMLMINMIKGVSNEELWANLSEELLKEHASLIDYSKADLEQFQNYFHFQECMNAVPLSGTRESEHPYFNSFWEVFKFDGISRTDIYLSLRKKDIEIIQNKLSETFSGILDEQKNKLSDYEIKKLKNKLVKKNTQFRRAVYDLEETEKKDNQEEKEANFETLLGLIIEESDFRIPKYYIYLIQLYYLEEKIDKEQIFILYFYIFQKVKERQNRKELIKETLETAATISSKVPSNGALGLSYMFSFVKNGWSLIDAIVSRYNESDFVKYQPVEKSEYEVFKENFWRYISFDKETLSQQAFQKKYGIFEFWYQQNSKS